MNNGVVLNQSHMINSTSLITNDNNKVNDINISLIADKAMEDVIKFYKSYDFDSLMRYNGFHYDDTMIIITRSKHLPYWRIRIHYDWETFLLATKYDRDEKFCNKLINYYHYYDIEDHLRESHDKIVKQESHQLFLLNCAVTCLIPDMADYIKEIYIENIF